MLQMLSATYYFYNNNNNNNNNIIIIIIIIHSHAVTFNKLWFFLLPTETELHRWNTQHVKHLSWYQTVPQKK